MSRARSEEMSPGSRRSVLGLRPGLWLALICAGAVLVHLPLLWGEFTNFDDGGQITENETISNPSWESFHQVLTTNFDRKNANPMYISFMLNWALTPWSYTGFAVFNLAWLVITILVFHRFAGLFLSTPRWQLLATALFAVHGVKADLVGWMSARCHFMAMPFFLAAFVAWQRYIDAVDPRERSRWYALALLAGVAACLNKNLFVVVFPLLIVYDLAQRRRPGPAFFVDKLLPAALAYLIVTVVPGKVEWSMAHKADSWLENLSRVWLTDMNLLAQYLFQLVVPTSTSVAVSVFPVDGLFEVSEGAGLAFMEFTPAASIAALILLVSAAVLAWRVWELRLPFWALLWTLVALLPVLNVIPFWLDFAFRFCWIPLTFWCVAAVGSFAALHRRLGRVGKRMALGLLAAYLACHAGYSVEQSASFESPERYFSRCLESFPDARMVAFKLGQYRARNYPAAAIEAYLAEDRVLVEKRTGRPFFSRFALVNAFKRLGDEKRAALHYERLLLRSSGPDSLSLQPKARRRIRRFLKKNPIHDSDYERFGMEQIRELVEAGGR
ncbi:MAG: hypothetical protein R6V85_06650 [Polyangia bacterium]